MRAGTVQVRCESIEDGVTHVDVSYTLTALTDKGAEGLASFEGKAFADLIDNWKRSIDQHLPALLSAAIR